MREALLERHRDPASLFDVAIEPPTELLLEVSAAYEATYRKQIKQQQAAAASSNGQGERGEGERGNGLSYVWTLFGDFLRRIKSNQLRQRAIGAPWG